MSLTMMVQTLFNEIKHGDAEHQKWLKEKLESFFNVKLED
jgi:ribosome-binding protein aMBF1 (putative translation factor)